MRANAPFGPVIVAALLAPCAGHAWDILAADVVYDDRAYEVSFQVRIGASASAVRRVVTDYANLTRLSPTIVKSQASVTAHGVMLRLWLRPCIWVFCRNLRKVSVVYEDGDDIVYDVDPGVSDFVEATERLTIADAAGPPGAALVVYRARLKPRFAVPPVIGPWLIKRHILQDLQITSQRVESLAAGMDETKR